ncbi:50S ribosomal protein L32 [Chloroflexota bacterium]
MGALPKRKTAKARRDKRRSHNAITPPSLDTCSQCNSPKLPHHVCPECGYYGDREVIETKGIKKKAE